MMHGTSLSRRALWADLATFEPGLRGPLIGAVLAHVGRPRHAAGMGPHVACWIVTAAASGGSVGQLSPLRLPDLGRLKRSANASVSRSLFG